MSAALTASPAAAQFVFADISKSFTNDPVAPGDTVTLQFTITNNQNFLGVNTLAFTDDLNATLAGLAAVGLPANNVCGAGSQISGTTTLSFTGGVLAGSGSCTFSVTLQVPATAPAGTFTNTTSDLSGLAENDIGPPSPFTATPATDDLVIVVLAGPGLTLDKQTSTDGFSMVSDQLDYTYLITNSGNTTITSPITVSDDQIAAVSCSGLPVGGLTPGQSITCTATDTVDEADLLAGSVTNVATATDGTTTSNTDTVTILSNDNEIRRKTQETISNFMHRRNDLLLSEEPDRNRLIRRLPGSLFGDDGGGAAGGTPAAPFNLGLSGGSGTTSNLTFATSLSQIRKSAAATEAERIKELGPAMALGKSGLTEAASERGHGFDIWSEGHYTHFDDDNGNADRSGHLGVIYVGADYLINSAFLVGALVQFDWAEDESNRLMSKAKGHGWMAGPYMSARLTPNIFFDARAAWGQSDNEVTPPGLFVENFDTTRWLTRANLTGNWTTGNWRFTPHASVAYIEDKQASFTNSLGIFIPGQTSSLGRASFGPEIGYRQETDDGTLIEPHLKLEGLWDFDQPSNLTVGGLAISPDEFRGEVTAGIQIKTLLGFGMRATASYDGIGQNDFNAYGGQLGVNIPLN